MGIIKFSIVKKGKWTMEAIESGMGCHHLEHYPKELQEFVRKPIEPIKHKLAVPPSPKEEGIPA